MTRFPSSPNRTLKALDSEQSTPSLPMLLEQTHFHAKWSAALLVPKPFYALTRCSHSFHPRDSPFALCCSLRPQLTFQTEGTATQTPQVTRTNSLSCKIHPNAIVRIPPILLILRHYPFMSPSQSYLAKLLAQREDYNNPPSSAQQIRSK